MALSSHQSSKSLVEVSESPLFHYQYSSLFKCIESFPLEPEPFAVSKMMSYCLEYLPKRNIYYTQLDVTPCIYRHSPTLEDRQYIKVANSVVPGGKPVDIGYPLSCLHVQGLEDEKWSLPVSLHRLASHQNSKEVGVNQLKSVLESEQLPFHQADLVVNTADSDYQHPSFLAPLYECANLVNVVRLRKGSKIHKCHLRLQTGGRTGYKGDSTYLLIESQTRKAGNHPYFANAIFDTFPFDDKLTIQQPTTKGRSLTIHLHRFNDFLLQTKKGYKMVDKPVDILVCQVLDTKSKEQVFAPMYLAICGKRKTEVSTLQTYQAYRHRYDIEPAFRLGKQQLKLDKYQTSKAEYFDKWLNIYQLAYWLLFVSSDEVVFQTPKWRSYKPENKPENLKEHLSPAQTFSSLETLLLKIDSKPFKARPSNKGKGRKKGLKFTKQTRHPVVRKRKKQTKIDRKEQQNE